MNPNPEALLQLKSKLQQLKQYQKENMIDFMDWKSYEKQWAFMKNVIDRVVLKVGNIKIYCLFGGNRCLGGDQKIYDADKKKFIKVKDIDSDFSVFAWDGKKRLKAKALKPFIKGKDTVYLVHFRNGLKTFFSANHRILDADGTYRPVSQLPRGGGFFLHRSTLVFDLLNQLLDGLSFLSIIQGFRACYRFLFHSYGVQLLSMLSTDLKIFQQPSGAHRHISFSAFLRMDGQGSIKEYSHAYLSNTLLSTLDDFLQNEGLFSHFLYRVLRQVLKFALFLHRATLHILSVLTYPILLIFLLARLGKCILFFVSSLITSKTTITHLEEIGVQDIYDFEVEEYQNYFIGGIVNHNSGKTEAGGGIVSIVSEKKGNLRIMCSTVDSKTSIGVQQKKLDKLIRKSAIKYGLFSPQNGYTNDMILMKNGTEILFRTYMQGREAFQGLDLDLIWGDEEMPWDVFQESLARLTDRDGVFLMTFTSLSGFTRLVNMIWESDNPIVKTAVLSILDNPFISEQAKKNYLLTVDPDEIESRVHGRPHIKTGLIYKSFGEPHKIRRFDYFKLLRQFPKRFAIHECIDPHSRTPHHWVRFLYDFDTDTIYIVEELEAPQEAMPIRDFAKIIKLKRYGVEPDFCQIDTSSETVMPIHVARGEEQNDLITIRSEFRAAGIDTILCIKDNSIGIGSVNHRLRVFKGDNGEILKKPKMYVFDDCKGVIWEFTRYSWDQYSSERTAEKKEMLNRPMKKDDHFMDCIKYESIYVTIVIKKENPKEAEPEAYPGTGV